MIRLRPILAFAARVAIIAIAVISIPWRAGAALVATGDAVARPPTPDALMAYVQAYGWIVGVLTVAFVAVRYLLQRYAKGHPLAQGRTLAALTTVVGVAGTALQAYTSGTPWSGVLATAVLGLLHLADAQVTPAAVKASQAGFGRLSVMLMLAAAGVALVAAMGCGASQRETTIRAALVSVDSARDGFLAYDRSHEMSLTAHCDPAVDTREQCQAKIDASSTKLAAYQAQRAKVDPLFGAAYRAIAAAEILADDPSLAGMQNVITQLFAAVKPFLSTTTPTATGSK